MIEAIISLDETPADCNGDISYDEGSLQEVWTVTMTMTDVECLRLIEGYRRLGLRILARRI